MGGPDNSFVGFDSDERRLPWTQIAIPTANQFARRAIDSTSARWLMCVPFRPANQPRTAL